MKKNTRTGVYCVPVLALALAAMGCGGEPIDEEGEVVDDAADLDDAEQGLAAALPNLKPRIVSACTGNSVQWEVKNFGAGTAAASVSGVAFDDPPITVYRQVPKLLPGQKFVALPVLIPGQPDKFVGFHVTADIHKKVTETNENDNVVGSYCDWN
jgi:hypothetical protein